MHIIVGGMVNHYYITSWTVKHVHCLAYLTGKPSAQPLLPCAPALSILGSIAAPSLHLPSYCEQQPSYACHPQTLCLFSPNYLTNKPHLPCMPYY